MGRAGERRGGNWVVVLFSSLRSHPRDVGARRGSGTGQRQFLHAMGPGRVVEGGHGQALPAQPLGQPKPVPGWFPNGK